MKKGRVINIEDNKYILTAEEVVVKKARGKEDILEVKMNITVEEEELREYLSIKDIKARGIDKTVESYAKDSFNGANMIVWGSEDLEEKQVAVIEEKMVLEKDIAHIEMQIENAREEYLYTGNKADVNWYRKAKHALNIKRVNLKRINLLLTMIKEEVSKMRKKNNIKETNTKARLFEKHASKLLTKELFDEIDKRAEKEYEEINKNAKNKETIND